MSVHSIYNIILVIFTLVLNFSAAQPNFPDETGGYAISIAFNEDFPEPENDATTELLENVQTSLSAFSSQLWDASRHHFYIKSVDILVPSTWKINANNSLNHNYDTAAIRISSYATQAHADNPFTCGTPGNFIELPSSFFNSSVGERYGPNSNSVIDFHIKKALLNLWATYRWGVFEEHGYIGDSKYPYSYRNLETDEFHVTGCSDQPISGRYMDNESNPCSASETLNPLSTCRFVPGQLSNNATTSIMHFHWIESIVGFCDETNHDKLSPNRQNTLCNYKSAWEVIRETRDFKMVSNPMNLTLPPVPFNVVQHSIKPKFYILLDRGSIQGSIGLASLIPRAITNFLAGTERIETIAAVGTFPGKDDEASIDQEIEWMEVGSNLNKFVDVIGNLRINGSLMRNFPRSIMTAVNYIKANGHPNGVVMLVVKYGADLSNFANYLPESEVLHALRDQGIILNAIELSIANHTGYSHLSELAQGTGGTYTVISNRNEAQTALDNVFWYLNKILNEDYKELRKTFRTILQTNIAPGSASTFKVPKLSTNETQDISGSVDVLISSTDGSLSVNNFSVEGISAENPSEALDAVVFRKRQDWQEIGSKWTYSLKLQYEKILPYSEVSVRTNCATCKGTMLIVTDLPNEASRNVTISVFVNGENSSVDLSRKGPIIILAKVLKSTTPVVGAQVMAIITNADRETTSTVNLVDNGEESPDDLAFDGIYSGYFVPNRDGVYKISVLVQGNEQNTFFANSKSIVSNLHANALQQRHGKLLPVDQDMGCGVGAQCDAEVLSEDFMQSVDLPVNLNISNTANYTPEPTKISTLIINAGTDALNLIWLAPQVPGTFFSVSSYDMRQSTTRANLINDFDSQEQVPGVSAMKPKAPNTPEMIQLTNPPRTTFYAIRSVYKGMKSKVSEVFATEVRDDDTAPPTSTTTISSTTSAGSTTDASETTTEENPITSSDGPTGPSSTECSKDCAVTTSEPEKDKKPWAKTGGGIAIITIIVIIAVAATVVGAYFLWKLRNRSTVAKINPPPQQPKSSLPA